ncbi:hypothetical protein FOB41_10045 [Agrobacterium pusense]|uniref:Lipoprotein n=1 Tax=Agrobacterium pusense TaxID=648995 RepID=A0A6H0ZNH7_9HYPH|nr:hypothetical protein [Agrobacterium pusense]QIX21451.1 hypothetical protein FOB41_10045 [Agrobacterium pusense]
MNRIAIAMALAASVTLTACSDDAQIASQNLSKAANNFEVSRRIIFYNGITDTYMLTIEGLCSISVGERKLDVTCKTGPGQYKKHFLGLSDNVTFFAEQLEGKSVSAYHYRVTFKPQSIIPDVNFRGDGKEITANQ